MASKPKKYTRAAEAISAIAHEIDPLIILAAEAPVKHSTEVKLVAGTSVAEMTFVMPQ